MIKLITFYVTASGECSHDKLVSIIEALYGFKNLGHLHV